MSEVALGAPRQKEYKYTRENVFEDTNMTDFRKDLLGYVRSRVYNDRRLRDYAEDIVNDVIIKLINAIEDGDDIENVRGWCIRAANNLIIDKSRSNLTNREVKIGGKDNKGDELPGLEAASAGNNFESDFARREFVSTILQFLQQEDNRKAKKRKKNQKNENSETGQQQDVSNLDLFTLKEVEELSLEDISKITGKSENYLKVNSHRMRQKIHRRFGDRYKKYLTNM